MLWWSVLRLVLVSLAIGVVVGALLSSPVLGGVSAGALVTAIYVWRNHVVPARVPRELRPPRR